MAADYLEGKPSSPVRSASLPGQLTPVDISYSGSVILSRMQHTRMEEEQFPGIGLDIDAVLTSKATARQAFVSITTARMVPSPIWKAFPSRSEVASRPDVIMQRVGLAFVSSCPVHARP